MSVSSSFSPKCGFPLPRGVVRVYCVSYVCLWAEVEVPMVYSFIFLTFVHVCFLGGSSIFNIVSDTSARDTLTVIANKTGRKHPSSNIIIIIYQWLRSQLHRFGK
jgi:hypothetical protein